jgi:CBS domain-containing protein
MSVDTNGLERRLVTEHQSLAQPLRTLVRRPLVACDQESSLANALATMQREGVGSIVVIDERRRPIGIFTERDLLAVALDDRLATPIAQSMTRNPVGLPGHTPAYEAALAMVEQRIRHVLVIENDQAIGVVSERDLFALQRLGLGELTLEIRLARTTDALAGLAERVRRLTRLMVEEGVAAEPLTLFVSVLNDRIGQRVIDVVRSRYQWDRLGWCWLAFGSEGRLEQTFASDQDNGLIFESYGNDSPQVVRALLLPFAREVNVALDACGYPLCKGNVMASNPELCLSFAEWKDKMSRWLHNSDPKALLEASIYFDFRRLQGDGRLASALREWLLDLTGRAANFLRLMAENALQTKPPLGLWSALTGEGLAAAGSMINLKLYGIRPLVDTARIMALARGLPATGTADRLRAVADAGGLPKHELEAALAAFFFVQGVRLRHQAALDSHADDAGNRIDPASLNELDRKTLKEALRIARDLQARLALDYGL